MNDEDDGLERVVGSVLHDDGGFAAEEQGYTDRTRFGHLCSAVDDGGTVGHDALNSAERQ